MVPRSSAEVILLFHMNELCVIFKESEAIFQNCLSLSHVIMENNACGEDWAYTSVVLRWINEVFNLCVFLV